MVKVMKFFIKDEWQGDFEDYQNSKIKNYLLLVLMNLINLIS